MRSGKAERERILYFSLYPLLALLAVLAAVGSGALIVYLDPVISQGLRKLSVITLLGPLFWALVISIMLTMLIVIFQQYEVAAALISIISVVFDWFLAFYILAPILAVALLIVLFLNRSPDHPWIEPSNLWLWGLFLIVSIFPAIQGAQTPYDTLTYYPNIILGALIMFWLGTLIGKDVASVRRFLRLVAVFGTVIALHLIIETGTGKSLFMTSNSQAFLASTSDYQIGNTGILRFGSFFLQPDAGSAFLAMIFFIPLGLYLESRHIVQKVIFLIEATLIAVALLFTYNTSAWLSAAAGIAVFFVLAGSMRFRLQLVLCIVVTIGILLVGFPSQINLLFQHSTTPGELILRQALWQTALRVIQAFPLTGIGLGRQVYLQKEEAYRVSNQYLSYNNPHNSYLELGAMGGLPVLFLFLMLLISALYQAIGNWKCTENKTRPLLCGGIAAIISLSFNSWSFGVWTLAPLAVTGWLLLGVISSPLITKQQGYSITE